MRVKRFRHGAARQDGATSLLVVFMLLVLVTFGMLSLTAAAANLRLSRKTVTWAGQYYALDGAAQRCLNRLDILLSAGESLDGVAKEIEADCYEITLDEDTLSFTLQSAENEKMFLTVTLKLLTQESVGTRYSLTEYREWQFEPEYNNVIQVWDGK